MSIDNTVTISGRAGAEPTLRYTPGGQAVASFGIAVDHRWLNKSTQEWESKTSWVDVTAWAQLAENVSESVTKGTRVTVTGRLDQRSWTTPEGDNRSKIEIVCDDIAISLRFGTAEYTRNEKSEGSGGGATSSQATRPAPTFDPNEEPFHWPAEEWMPGHWGEYPDRILP